MSATFTLKVVSILVCITLHSFTTAWRVVGECLQTSQNLPHKLQAKEIFIYFATNFTFQLPSKLLQPLTNQVRIHILSHAGLETNQSLGLRAWGLKVAKKKEGKK